MLRASLLALSAPSLTQATVPTGMAPNASVGVSIFAGRLGSLATKAANARIELAYPFHQSLQHPTLNPRVECQVQRR
jgi:hypothetical protein